MKFWGKLSEKNTIKPSSLSRIVYGSQNAIHNFLSQQKEFVIQESPYSLQTDQFDFQIKHFVKETTPTRVVLL